MNKEAKKELEEIIILKYWKVINYISWYQISCHKYLSENFIREYQYEIYWDYISTHQNLSEEFIREFQNRLTLDWMLEDKKISQKLYNELTYGISFTRSDILDFD